MGVQSGIYKEYLDPVDTKAHIFLFCDLTTFNRYFNQESLLIQIQQYIRKKSYSREIKMYKFGEGRF